MKVVNKRTHTTTPDDVYIGRPSKWGNPFQIGDGDDRDAVVAKYGEWIMKQRHLLASLDELRGKNLVCWCAPLPCHGDVLLQLVRDKIRWEEELALRGGVDPPSPV